MNHWRRGIAIALLLGLVPIFSTGCFGKFQLLKKVYKVNEEISQDKWIRWLAFLGLNIVPIYGIAVFVDVIFANSVEFWTGENPIEARVGETHWAYGPNGEVLRMALEADGSLGVAVFEGERVSRFKLVRENDAISAWDAQGELLARVTDEAGNAALVAGSLAKSRE